MLKRMLALSIFCTVAFGARLLAQEPVKAIGDWNPRIHFYASPLWINDPNGPILLNGQYNLFFQNNPYGDQWGHMSWGHAVSTDLVHWKTLPVAIPEANGVAIFSGSTVEDAHNTSGFCSDSKASKSNPGCLVAIYTGNSDISPGNNRQNQNLAYSRDGGKTWTKYAQNPVLDRERRDFRDPKVFWDETTRTWIMTVVVSDKHTVEFYRSSDLKHWNYLSEFGPTGAIGGVWECPDLLQLEVRDSKGKRVGNHWVLSVNLNPGGIAGGSGDQYFVGQFDGTRFTEDHPNSGQHWADWGKDFYASTAFSNIPANQNQLWIAWMGNWQYAGVAPSLPGRGEMTLPRRIYLREEEETGDTEPLVLVQEPVLPPVSAAPKKSALSVDEANAKLGGKEPGDSVYLLRATLEPGSASELGIRLRRSTLKPGETAEEETVVGIDRAKGKIFVDRRHSGLVSFSSDFPARTVAPLRHPQAKTIPIEIVVDRNSVEVFAENGETVLTNLIYPSDASQGLAFYANGVSAGGKAPAVLNLEVAPLK
jgi:sucrose-6-phosphate hydrolase SacC (GH32 family)